MIPHSQLSWTLISLPGHLLLWPLLYCQTWKAVSYWWWLLWCNLQSEVLKYLTSGLQIQLEMVTVSLIMSLSVMLSAVLFFWSLMFSVSTQMIASNMSYFLCSDICGGWSRCSSEISMDTQFWWLHLGHPRYLCGFSWSGVPTSINCDPRSISNGIFTIWILRHFPFSAHCYSTSCYTTPASPWPGRLAVKKQQKCWKWRGYYQESPESGWPLTAQTARHSCRNTRLFGLNSYPRSIAYSVVFVRSYSDIQPHKEAQHGFCFGCSPTS